MLTELFVASIGTAMGAASTHAQKDAGIFVHEYQPLQQQRATFKKSATGANCLATSGSHIFAAQCDKAVVHVYSREKGNQEATVPFPEQITCLTLACDGAVLVLGTAEGRIMLWEVASGRQVTTSQVHLQLVTALVVDPTNNFLLSASADSTVHVWSLPALLAFATIDVQSLSPLSTFTHHRAEVSSLALGHSSSFCNIAVSASQDKTCLVWDYHTGAVLKTYLLLESSTCVVLDAADRYAYVGYDDGNVQRLDLYNTRDASHSSAPIQPPLSSRWASPDRSLGGVLSVSVSFDGLTVLTGHQSGNVCVWEAGRGKFVSNVLQAPLAGPVTNLTFLPAARASNDAVDSIRIPMVVKPRFGAFDHSNGEVPSDYSLNVALTSNLATPSSSAFLEALTGPVFPQDLLDEGLAELAAWGKQPGHRAEMDEAEDFMALDGEATGPMRLTLEEQNSQLGQELEALRRVQKISFERMEKLRLEKEMLLKRQQRIPAVNGTVNGHSNSSDED